MKDDRSDDETRTGSFHRYSVNGHQTKNGKSRSPNLSRKKFKTDVIDFTEAKDEVVKYKKQQSVELVPRNLAQETYVSQLLDKRIRVTFALGPAGTGKTYLSVLRAIRAFKFNEVNRIVITRPAVGVQGENHGFLPGDLNKKMEPWLMPIMDVFHEFWSPMEIERMIENKIIEISPLMYMRGRTFKDCYLILDEAQNTTPEQMKMFLTRLGSNTKASITGDLNQHDQRKENGLLNFTNILKEKNSSMISYVQFGIEHIERDVIVKEILTMYGDE